MQRLQSNEIINLSDDIIRVLAQNRIITVVDFLQEDVTKLCTLTKLILPEVIAARNNIFDKYSARLINGTALLSDNLDNKQCVPTGIGRLDVILRGGIPTRYITELCGLAGSGKTQLCFQIAINCTKNSKFTVLYIDTKGDFSAVRIQNILESSGFSHKEMALIMLRIKMVQVWTLKEAIEVLQNIKNKSINFEDLAMIIVDSLPPLMFQFLGDDNKIGLTMLNTFVNYSRYLCKELNICMICTNIQTRWVDQDIADFDEDREVNILNKEVYVEKRIRCLGKYWHHIPFLVLELDKLQVIAKEEDVNGDTFSVTVTKCSSLLLAKSQCTININNMGVT